MYDLRDAVLLTLHATGNVPLGLHVIQKIFFFEDEAGLVSTEWLEYFFGLHSVPVTDAIRDQVRRGYVVDNAGAEFDIDFTVPEAWRRYQYQLSNEGIAAAQRLITDDPAGYARISEIVTVCSGASGLDVMTLACAAGLHYAEDAKQQWTEEEKKQVARTFDWQLTDTQIDDAITILRRLKLG